MCDVYVFKKQLKEAAVFCLHHIHIWRALMIMHACARHAVLRRCTRHAYVVPLNWACGRQFFLRPRKLQSSQVKGDLQKEASRFRKPVLNDLEYLVPLKFASRSNIEARPRGCLCEFIMHACIREPGCIRLPTRGGCQMELTLCFQPRQLAGLRSLLSRGSFPRGRVGPPQVLLGAHR